jgi:hypothetical protein
MANTTLILQKPGEDANKGKDSSSSGQRVVVGSSAARAIGERNSSSDGHRH